MLSNQHARTNKRHSPICQKPPKPPSVETNNKEHLITVGNSEGWHSCGYHLFIQNHPHRPLLINHNPCGTPNNAGSTVEHYKVPHHKTAGEQPTECDKALKAST